MKNKNMKEENFSIIENGEVMDDLTLSMIVGGFNSIDKQDDCDHCNTCGDGGNNSQNGDIKTSLSIG